MSVRPSKVMTGKGLSLLSDSDWAPGALPAAIYDLLVLTVMERVPDGAEINGLPGVWSPLPGGRPGARVQLGADEQLLIDGVAAVGTVDIDASDPLNPQKIAMDPDHSIVVLRLEDAGAGEIWVGLTSARAPRLQAYRGVSSYPDDDRWRIPVSFIPADEAGRVSMVRRFRGGRQPSSMKRAGWFDATIDGQPYRFSVDQISNYAYVSFRDAGSGTESYGAGRVVRLPADPASIDVLDLNEAAVLPCAFNPLLNCPLPPDSNVIRSVVRAGQRDVIFEATG